MELFGNELSHAEIRDELSYGEIRDELSHAEIRDELSRAEIRDELSHAEIRDERSIKFWNKALGNRGMFYFYTPKRKKFLPFFPLRSPMQMTNRSLGF